MSPDRDWEPGAYRPKEEFCCSEIIEVRQAFRDHVRGAEGANHAHIELTMNAIRADMVVLLNEQKRFREEIMQEISASRRWQYTVMGGIALLVFLVQLFGREVAMVIFHTGG